GIRDFHVTGVQTCALPIWLNTLAGLGEVLWVLVQFPQSYQCKAMKSTLTVSCSALFMKFSSHLSAFPSSGAGEPIRYPVRSSSRSEEHTSELQSRENLVCR